MHVSLTETGGLNRRLEVAVPATEVTREVQQRLKQLSRTARLKGFRPGKAPLGVITKQFGDQVRSEVLSDLMRTSFAQAVTQENLRPAAGPRIEPITLGPDTDLKYAAHFEVLPEVTISPPEALAIDKPTGTVTDGDVDAMIENMRAQRPNYSAVERPARNTDRVVFDYQVRIGDKVIEDGDVANAQVVLGARQTMPELEEGLAGVTAGQSKVVAATFPPNHPNQRVAGQPAELHLSIKAVEEQSLPAVDEEFFRAYGVESGGIEEMRAEVRRSMERELAGAVRNQVRAQVMDALLRANPVDVPRAMVDEQVQQLQLDAARRMGIQDPAQLPARENFVDPARRRVALGLLISQIVQSNSMKVERERVQARLDELIESYPDPDQARRAYLQNQDAMRSIESGALEEQVIDWILARAQVTEQPRTFKDLTGFGQAAGHVHDDGHEHEHAPALGAGPQSQEQVSGT
jgi:trigger factor